MAQVTINADQRLYVIRSGNSHSCLGFDVVERKIDAVAQWLRLCGAYVPPVTSVIGTVDRYQDYLYVMAAGQAYSTDSGKRCGAELTTSLQGLEGKRVEVVDCDGERRRFIVGKSTGWLPCHLEIARRNSSGGSPADTRGYRSVRALAA